MKKTLIICSIIGLTALGCGGSEKANAISDESIENVSSEMEAEIEAIDSTSKEIESIKKEIDQSSEELDQLLNGI